jgi:predicted aspartyl protease
MIIGAVNDDLEATIRLVVRRPGGTSLAIDAIIDTGFTGHLTLPSAIIAALGLPWRRRGRAQLADGSTHVFNVYEAQIDWDGTTRSVIVDAADVDPPRRHATPVWLRGLTIQAIPGGRVTIAALP